MEEENIIGIWDLFVEFIPEKHREQAAAQYIDLLLEYVDLETLEEVHGCNHYLDDAIDEAIENARDDEDDDWQEDD